MEREEQDMKKRRKGKKTLPPHLKYPKYLTPAEERAALLEKSSPSMVIEDMTTKTEEKTSQLKRPVPEIIEFLDLERNTMAVFSTVRIDEPLFQPYPLNLQFRDYEPFGTYTKTLYFRNNDSFPRRIYVQNPDSPYFSIRQNSRSQDRIAAGMETSYEITFRPNEKREYHQRLICVTEREKFIVEISALGPWSCINFPDEVGFGTCPVNYNTPKTFLVRNIGEKGTKFVLNATAPFQVEPKSGYIPLDSSMQITLNFNPTECVDYEGELEIIYESGQKVYTHLHGTAENVSVRLSDPLVELDAAYITLTSTRTFKILNHSDIPVKFDFRAFCSKAEEAEERLRLHEELNRLENSERQEIESKMYEDHPEKDAKFQRQTDLAMITKKFQLLHNSVEEDLMHFVDKNFSIEPISGEIWSHSEKEITLTFKPSVAADFVSVACLSVSGREHRLPLKMHGRGIGPKAGFSYNIVDVHDVFVNSVHRYELQLENRGDIKCIYELSKTDSTFGEKFHFTPDKGVLQVDESHTIQVRFCSEVLGDFSEYFTFKMQGSNEDVKVQFRGTVIGPTFEFDIENLDFGRIPYGFLNERNFNLHNTSEIPMTYKLHVPGDGKFNENEFIITPSEGTIQPKQIQPTNLRFTSQTVTKYDMYVAVDIDVVGEEVFKLPIFGQCVVPEVSLAVNNPPIEDDEEEEDHNNGDIRLSYGKAFIRHEYSRKVILRNHSDVQAKFTVLDQDESSFCIANYSTTPTGGVIEPQSEVELTVKTSCQKLGKISVPLFIQIAGSDKPPMMVDVVATCVGPNIVLDKTDIDFGPVTCLQTVRTTVKLTNDSLIPAPFKTFLKGSKSRFTVDCQEGCLAPGESIVCEISANLDDTIVHRDDLNIIVTEGENTILPLKAKGIGTTMFCAKKEELELCDFGTIFTSRVCEQEFIYENRGRRDQLLTWTNLDLEKARAERNRKIVEIERMRKDKDEKVVKKAKKMKFPEEPNPAFSMYPDQVVLKPRMACRFRLSGETPTAGQITERFVLNTKVGKNAKIPTKVIETEFKANFINPLIEASSNLIEFCYTFDKIGSQKETGVLFKTLTKELTLKNISSLPLNFVLRTQIPFTVDTWEISIQPEEQVTINVLFDPSYRDDCISHEVEGKLVAVHQNHPQRDTFNIKAQIYFPNLDFDKEKLAFGCILNETTKSTTMTVTNSSKVESSFSWSFIEEEANNTKSGGIPMNQVFDFRPIKGNLLPGESMEIEVVFYGHANKSFKTFAVCEVEGGPDYEFELSGEASEISYRLDRDSFDFGDLVHDQSEELELTIYNQGKVSFDFTVVLDGLSRPGIIQCVPMQGPVLPRDSQKLIVQFTPGIPDKIAENIILEVAHFEPISIPVYGKGIFGSVSLNLPRYYEYPENNEKWQNLYQESIQTLKSSSVEFAAKLELFGNGIVVDSELSEIPDQLNDSASVKSLVVKQDSNDMLTDRTDLHSTNSAPETRNEILKRKAHLRENPNISPPSPSSSGNNSSGKRERMSQRERELHRLKIAIETEASRLKFVNFLMNQGEFIGTKPESISATSSNTSSKEMSSQPLEAFSIADHVIDFGNVIVGTSRKRGFRMYNTGSFPISLSVEKPFKTGHIFSVEPSKVAKVSEGGYVDFMVQYSAKRNTPLGEVLIKVPIDVRDGPPVMIYLKANVTIPDVSLLANALDFGSLMVGECRVMAAQICNTSPVPAEWSIKTSSSNTSESSFGTRGRSRRQGNSARSDEQESGDSAYFVCKPESGMLQPGHCCNIEIVFTPTENRNYLTKLPIKINYNSKIKNIACRGVGSMYELELSESLVELDPTLPFADKVNKKLLLKNKSTRDIEVYSIEFDKQYKEEEEIINTLFRSHLFSTDSLTSNNSIKIAPRKPKEGLPQRLIDTYKRVMKEKLETESDEAGTEHLVDGEPSEVRDVVGELETPGAKEADIQKETSLTYRDRGLAVDVVFLGPPLSGKAKYAERTSGLLGGLPVLCIDEILEWAAKQGVLSTAICKKYEIPVEEEQSLNAPEDSTEEPNISVELLAKVIRQRIFESDCSSGVVLNNIRSKYLTDEEQMIETAQAVKIAFLPKKDSVLNFVPNSQLKVVFISKDLTIESLNERQERIQAYVNESLEVSETDANTGIGEEEIKAIQNRLTELQSGEEIDLYFRNVNKLIEVFQPSIQSGADEVPENQSVDDVEGKNVEEANQKEEGISSSPDKDEEKETQVQEEQEEITNSDSELIPILELNSIDVTHVWDIIYDERMDEYFPRPGTPRAQNTKNGWKLAVPPPVTYQLIKKPHRRKQSQKMSRFSLALTKKNQEATTEDESEALSEDIKNTEEPTRWVIPAGKEISLDVQFFAEKQGKYEQQLLFEIVGGQRQYWTVVRGVCTVPALSTDPRNVFMNRIKSRPHNVVLSKKFIMASGVYEFGPLLVGKSLDMKESDSALAQKNCEIFRFSNSGILPIDQLDLSIVEDGKSSEDESTGTFIVNPENLTLLPGETKDVEVWAFPQQPNHFTGTIIGSIKDNPEPIQFPISCLGSKPLLGMYGPWDNKETENDEIEATSDNAENKEYVLSFDRLLLKHHEEKYFTVKNECDISVQWSLDLEQIETITELRVSPTEGTLKAGQSVSITVEFSALEEAIYETMLHLVYTDIEVGNEEPERQTRVPIKVVAEAYDIQVKPKFEQDEESQADTNEDPVTRRAGLDFGTIRVFESLSKTFTLTNAGKYAVTYQFRIRRRQTRDLFKIEPMEGQLEAGQEENFTVTFFSRTQVRIKDNKDIQCTIMEAKSNEVFETFNVPTNACSVFSRFKLQPLKGINFGAVKFHTNPTRTFEIKNEGDFEFSFQVLNESGVREEHRKRNEIDNVANDNASEDDQDEIPDPYKAQKSRAVPNPDVPTGPMDICESFSIDEQGGIVKPGSSASVTVTFNAKNHIQTRSRIEILISGRNEEDIGTQHVGVPFEILGESCVPGINTENYESIFEEQAVQRVLNQEGDVKGVFATEERRFSFGAIIPTSVPPQGVCERFKISNPNNIKATVNLEITPNTEESSGVFSVHPSMIELPSHEYQFVSVYFKPLAMSEYSAKFSATVVDGEDAKTSKLDFDLHGEGTLPCLTVVQPSTLTNDACLLVDFGRLPVGKERQKEVILRNDGVVPAVVRFDMKLHDAFTYPFRNTSCNLAAQQTNHSHITFCPQTSGNFSHELMVRVLHNEFELSTIRMVGEAYEEDITFEDLPEQFDDELHFGDVILQKNGDSEILGEKSIQFSLRNQCSVPIRFEWAEQTNIQFSPNAGHIPPYGALSINSCVTSSDVLSLDSHVADVTCQKIEYTESAFSESKGKTISWNDSIKVIKENEDESEDNANTLETLPEPEYVVVEGTEAKVFQLKCFAQADFVKYECPLESPFEVKFRPTMMFQSRVYRFPIKNVSNVRLKYKWDIPSLPISDCPFSLTPKEGIIEPGLEESITLRFAPLEVEEYECIARATIDGLSEDIAPALDIKIKGTARRPICHFDMEMSDYLERRGPTSMLNSSENVNMDRDVRCVELESLGIKVKNTKRFYVVNPTNVAYNFTLEHVGEINGRFSCLTQQGLILPGRKYEIVFTFTPDTVEIQEAIWKFSIPEQSVSQTFLLVGKVIEPKINLERRHVNFHAVLVGGRSSEIVNIINNEHLPFSFSFDKASLQIGDSSSDTAHKPKKRILSLNPMSGTVGPNNKLPIEVCFAPGEEKSYNFNLACTVHRKPVRLSLNVKGEGSAVHDKVVLERPPETSMLSAENTQGMAERELPLTSGDNNNYVDFGQVHVNDRAKRHIKIYNSGKFNFDFVWTLPSSVSMTSSASSTIAFYPVRGTVPCGEHITCTLEFNPTDELTLKEIPLQCIVAGARKYKVLVSGMGSKPSLDFSFFRYDFGPCFVADRGTSARAEEHNLTISNNEAEIPVAIDCLFEKTDHMEVICNPTVLQPGESIQVPIRFTPRQVTKYSEVIPFEINGLYTAKVVMSGEGVVLKIELEKPETQHTVNFGSLRVGQEAVKTVKVVNRSKRSAYFSLKDMKASAHGQGYLEEQFVKFAPRGEVSLRPREAAEIELYYNPEHRQPPFSENLFIQVNGVDKPLVTITGACQGVDVKLETDTMSFGSVCERCKFTRKLCIRNMGDLGTKFRWDQSRPYAPNFDIFPTEGFLQPHSQLMFDVTFQPTDVAEDMRCEAVCLVDGNDVPSLPIVLSGACVPQPEEGIKELNFSSRVRETVSQSIDISNPDTSTWYLQPTINNEFWSGPERLEVPAGQTVKYDIEYTPHAMTSTSSEDETKQRHEGSVFFALPNGSSILYKLFGEATEPEAEDIISKEAVAKQPITIPLPVSNWLKSAQRFEVNIEKSDGGVSDTHFYRGTTTMDVPALKSRNYKLQFIGYLEGKSTAKVTLKNPKTKEYLFFEVNIDCAKADILGTVVLEAPVRQTVSDFIVIENPLESDEQVDFAQGEDDDSWWDCDDPNVKDCLRVRQVRGMTGGKEGTFEVTYRPVSILDDITECVLTLRSKQLGDFNYKLQLTSSKAGTERSLHFRSTLGASNEQVFRFRNYVTNGSTEFQCSVGQPLFFTVEPTIKVEPANGWEGTEVSVHVKFEPQAIGDVKDTLSITSGQGGEYSCVLYGKCEPPRPRGPILISSDKGGTIDFKNVFNEQKEFRFAVDSENFTVDGDRMKTQTIDEGKEVSVSIKCTSSSDSKVCMGKLLISCLSMPDMPPWVFYLKGDSQ